MHVLYPPTKTHAEIPEQRVHWTLHLVCFIIFNSAVVLNKVFCSVFCEQKQCGLWFTTNYSLKYKLPCGFSKGNAYWRSYIYKVGILCCEVLKYRSAVFIRGPYNLQRAFCSVIDLVCFSLRLQPKVNNRDTAATGDYR